MGAGAAREIVAWCFCWTECGIRWWGFAPAVML